MVAATVSPNTKDFLHQRQGATDSFFDFYKQEIFTYPLSNNFNLICLQNSNLSPRQSVVRCVKINTTCTQANESDLNAKMYHIKAEPWHRNDL